MSDKYKTYEELKEELGNNYDLFMYEINLCLLQKIDKAREYIKHENFKRNILLGFSEKKYVRDILNNVLEILGDKE